MKNICNKCWAEYNVDESKLWKKAKCKCWNIFIIEKEKINFFKKNKFKLMFVIVVIVLLFTYYLLIPKNKNYDLERVKDLNDIRTGIEMYYVDEMSYPDNLSDIPVDFFPRKIKWWKNKFEWVYEYYPQQLPVDPLEWKIIDWCEFWYKYYINWEDYTLETCLEIPEEVPWSKDWKYILWNSGNNLNMSEKSGDIWTNIYYDHIYDLKFSPDWKKYIATAITKDNKYVTLLDWKQYWESYSMIYSWFYSKDSSKYWFMWSQWDENIYLVENENKTKIENWKIVDDYIDTNFYYWITKDEYKACNIWRCRIFDSGYIYDIFDENWRKLYVNWEDKWVYYEIDWSSWVLNWDNYAFVWKKEKWWKSIIFINWEEKYSFDWYNKETYSNTYNYLTISDDWKNYAILINWKIIINWKELTWVEGNKDFEELQFTPNSKELNFLAYTTDWKYRKVMIKWWKIIWEDYNKVKGYEYSPDWKKLILIVEESWGEKLIEYK